MKKDTKLFISTIFLTLFAVFFAHWLSDVTGIEALTRFGAIGWIILFVYYCIFVFIGLKALDAIKL
jgi:hypothetical protein